MSKPRLLPGIIRTCIPPNALDFGFLSTSRISFRWLMMTRLADGRGIGTGLGATDGLVAEADIVVRGALWQKVCLLNRDVAERGGREHPGTNARRINDLHFTGSGGI